MKEHRINLTVDATDALKAIDDVNRTLGLILAQKLASPDTDDKLTVGQWVNLIQGQCDAMLAAVNKRYAPPTPHTVRFFAAIAAYAWAAIEAIERNDVWNQQIPHLEERTARIDLDGASAGESYRVNLESPGTVHGEAVANSNTFEVEMRTNEASSIRLNGMSIYKIKSFSFKGRELTLVMDIDAYSYAR